MRDYVLIPGKTSSGLLFRKLAKCRSDQAAVNLMESYFRPKLLAKIKTKLKSVLKCILYRSLFLAGRKEKTTLKSLNSCLNKLIIKDLHSNRLKCDTFQI